MDNLIISDILEYIDESFYLLDIDFNSSYCDILFNEIYKAFASTNKESQFRIDILKFVKNCMLQLNHNVEYDYNLFLSNIDYLDLPHLKKHKILANFQKQIEIKKIS